MNNEEQLTFILKKYEAQLKKLMGEKGYKAFETKVAKDLFIEQMKKHPNRDFQDFVFDNLDKILEDDDKNG